MLIHSIHPVSNRNLTPDSDNIRTTEIEQPTEDSDKEDDVPDSDNSTGAGNDIEHGPEDNGTQVETTPPDVVVSEVLSLCA